MDPADCVISVLSLNSIRSKSFRSVRVKPLHLQSSAGLQKRARYRPGGRPGDRALCTHQRPPAPKGSSGSFPGTSCVGAAWSPARGPALPSGGRHHREQRPRRAPPLSPALSAAGVFRPNATAAVLLLLPWLLTLLPAILWEPTLWSRVGYRQQPGACSAPTCAARAANDGGFCETTAAQHSCSFWPVWIYCCTPTKSYLNFLGEN